MIVMFFYSIVGINQVIPDDGKIPDEAVTMEFGIQFLKNVLSTPIQSA